MKLNLLSSRRHRRMILGFSLGCEILALVALVFSLADPVSHPPALGACIAILILSTIATCLVQDAHSG